LRFKTEGKDELTMKHIPYGYIIVDGKAEIDNERIQQVKQLFDLYLEGDSLATISKTTGLNHTHSQISRMLEKTVYLGDDFYPGIVSKEQFEKVKEERLRRATKLGRLNKAQPIKESVVVSGFKMTKPTKDFDDPFKKAEYLYGLIEVVVTANDG